MNIYEQFASIMHNIRRGCFSEAQQEISQFKLQNCDSRNQAKEFMKDRNLLMALTTGLLMAERKVSHLETRLKTLEVADDERQKGS